MFGGCWSCWVETCCTTGAYGNIFVDNIMKREGGNWRSGWVGTGFLASRGSRYNDTHGTAVLETSGWLKYLNVKRYNTEYKTDCGGGLADLPVSSLFSGSGVSSWRQTPPFFRDSHAESESGGSSRAFSLPGAGDSVPSYLNT